MTGCVAQARTLRTQQGRSIVVALDGKLLDGPAFHGTMQDLALLHTLGVRLVLVCCCEPQIRAQLESRGLTTGAPHDTRATTAEAIPEIASAVAQMQRKVEAGLSFALANSFENRVPVTSGNFVTARPLGVRDGVDHLLAGEARRIDTASIQHQLEHENVVLVAATCLLTYG